jgi:hypothetical protein
VSKFLSFEIDPVDQPAATDLVEKRTWSAMRIRCEQRFISRIFDKTLDTERSQLYLPAFPIAEWIVRKWWFLLNEPCPWETVPRAVVNSDQLSWIKRHCLRAADSALLLPALYFYDDGRGLRAEWHEDASGSLPNMTGEFISSGSVRIDADNLCEAFAGFVDETLGRVSDVDDHRVRGLVSLWQAIRNADEEERQFCSLAGRMGVDPYDPNAMTDQLSEFLERTVSDPDSPIIRDLTELGQPELIEKQWHWVDSLADELKFEAEPSGPSFDKPLPDQYAHDFGYQLARRVRAKIGNESDELGSVTETANSLGKGAFRVEDRNHVPGSKIKAVVGRNSREGTIAAGPKPQRKDSERFFEARCLYHMLATTENGHRLVTDTFSWDQKASRAFAAELLAPQRALANKMSKSTTAGREEIEAMSKAFAASTRVIEKQLENAGITVRYE